MNARTQALARQDQQMQESAARAEAARPPQQNALQAMGSRLNITPNRLEATLRNTVFKDANDDEFAALIIVANEYRLNPLTKEIYAFKAKGGGIIPYVSVDGWIRIINEHPQFDGIEFDDIFEGDELVAIECTIWRKDRTRPIKVAEYMDECVMDTGPWKKSPRRFLRHRSLMQCGRVAFGFSGIQSEDDYEIVGFVQQDGGENARPIQPRRDAIAHDAPGDDAADLPTDDRGMTEVDEETARSLDAGGSYDEESGELIDEEEELSPSTVAFNGIMDKLVAATTAAQVKAADAEFLRHHAAFTEQQIDQGERELAAAKRRLNIV